MKRRIWISASVLVLLAFSAALSFAQPYDPKYFEGMRWRNIGPFRGGRTRAVAGVPSQPNVFYVGVCNGGGDLPRLAVHPKNPDIVFVTSTVAWKSVDGGKTWTGFRGAPGGDDYQNIWINPNKPV